MGIGFLIVLCALAAVIVGSASSWDTEEADAPKSSAFQIFVLLLATLLLVKVIAWALIEYPVLLSSQAMLILMMAAMVVAVSGIGRQIGHVVVAMNNWLRKIDDHLSGNP